MRPPSKAGEGGVAARVAFGRSGFENTKNAGNDGAGKQGSSGKANAETPTTAAAAGEPAVGRREPRMRSAASGTARRVPGIERPEFDWNTVNKAGKEMHAQSRIAPPDAGAVAAAMAEFPAETQRGLAEFNATHPAKLREFAAQHLHSESLSDGQRDALMTIGSARGAAVETGMKQATGALDAQEAQGSPASRPPSVTSQPGGEAPAASTPGTPRPPARPPAAIAWQRSGGATVCRLEPRLRRRSVGESH